MVLNYRENFVKSCTINFMMQTAVMGTKYRSGFHFIFDLQINLKMIVRYPRGEPYQNGEKVIFQYCPFERACTARGGLRSRFQKIRRFLKLTALLLMLLISCTRVYNNTVDLKFSSYL
jgi:hypothetical protein